MNKATFRCDRSALLFCSRVPPRDGPRIDQGDGAQAISSRVDCRRRFVTSLFAQGYRIQDDQGRTLADLWLRKATPSSEKPAGPKGAIQFPFLADGELVGVLQFATRRARLSRSAHRQGRLHDALRLAAGQWRSSGCEHLSRLFAVACPRRKIRSLARSCPQATRGAQRRIGRDEPSRRLPVARGTARLVEVSARGDSRRRKKYLERGCAAFPARSRDKASRSAFRSGS